jgi:hypothetical protein
MGLVHPENDDAKGGQTVAHHIPDAPTFAALRNLRIAADTQNLAAPSSVRHQRPWNSLA